MGEAQRRDSANDSTIESVAAEPRHAWRSAGNCSEGLISHSSLGELTPLLKPGGDYENEAWTVKIAPPEERAEGKPFIDYRQKPGQ